MTLRNAAPANATVDRPVHKRVVLMHRSGIQSIAGAFVPGKNELKPYLELLIHGMKKSFGLIKVTPRAYYYREIIEPMMKAPTFDPRQV